MSRALLWAIALGSIAWTLAQAGPVLNPHPGRQRRKWSSYANTVARQPWERTPAVEDLEDPPRLDPDSSFADLYDWLYWYQIGPGDERHAFTYTELHYLPRLAQRDPERAVDLAWEKIRQLAEEDEF